MSFEKRPLRDMPDEVMDGLFGEKPIIVVVAGGRGFDAAYTAQVLASTTPDMVIVTDNSDVTAAFDDAYMNLLDDSLEGLGRLRVLRPLDVADVGAMLKDEVRLPVVDYPRWRQLQEHPRSVRKGRKGR